MRKQLALMMVLMLVTVSAVGQIVRPVSAGQVQKAKVALRILDNAFESFSATKWGDDLFDPFTVGLLRGLEDDMEDDRATHTLSKGDDGLNSMVRYEYQYFLHVTDLRSYQALVTDEHDDQAIEALAKRAMARYSSCHHEIWQTMRYGWKGNGECTFSKEVADAMHNGRKTAEAAMDRAAKQRRGEQ